MEFGQQLLRVMLGNLPKIAGLLPEKFKKNVKARFNDFNIFATLGANDDLKRALRLAWIEAALKVDKSAKDACASPDWMSKALDVENFSPVLRKRLKALRYAAFDRTIPLSDSPIDQHLQKVISKTPATLTGEQVDTGLAISKAFQKITADILGCELSDIPGPYQHIAERGLIAPGGGSMYSFGDMVLIVFTELIQDPKRYPQAGSAFELAFSNLGIELGQQCLKLLEGQERQFDQLLESLDVTPDGSGLGEWLGRVDTALASGFEKLILELNGLNAKIDQNTGAVKQVDTKVARLELLLAEVYKKLGGNQDPRAHQIIIDQAQLLLPDELIDFPRAVQEIEYAVCAALDIISKGGTDLYKDRFLDDAHASVIRSIETGQIDQGSRTIDQALAELDRREECEREIAKRQRKQLLELSIKHGAVAHAPERVADAEEKLLGIEHPDCPVMSEEYRLRFVHYFQEGEMHDVNFLLDVAVALARKRVEQAGDSRESGEALSWLGKSFARLGERAPSKDLLLRAEEVFREALDDSFQTAMPIDWAMAQNGLANVLQILGRRENSSDRFVEAVRIYQAVLSVFVQENLPLEIAEVRANLGAVLLAIGEREANPGQLHEAAQSLRVALEEPALEGSSLVWAMAKNNLGTVLRITGEREGNDELLRAAVNAHRAALQKRTLEVTPFLWATSQSDLGAALLTLGERVGNTDLIREAIDAFQASLSGRARNSAPLEWATTQHNLGVACWKIGELEGDIAMLTQANKAFELALQERTPLRGLNRWASTMSSLGNVLLEIGERENSPEKILKAKQTYEKALDKLSHELAPWDWALIKHNLGNAFLSLAEHEDGSVSLQAAIRAYQDALLVRTLDRGRAAWGRTKLSLGNAFLFLGEREADTQYLDRAIQEYQCALPQLSLQHRHRAERSIAIAQEIIYELRGSEA
ncbi:MULTISPECIES: tetratricopeptide repeat protein [unclassified Pseudomonas]|uniref:tetratricopeptide repeat protein n=1 Tax=unclassified Pseudomonas TaxID=196821 RepID=UPI002E804EB2|nr:tetratricopeptide repeat protein [Pseudomonas sp. Z18(2022)]